MPKIVDHDERRGHFIEAAIDVVIRDGFDGLTMRQIATEAGYTHGAIARYFPDKRSLLAAAFLRLNQAANQVILERTSGLRGLAALIETCRAILPYRARKDRGRVVLAFWERLSHDPDLQAVWEGHRGWRDKFAQHLEEAMLDGEIPPGLDIAQSVNEISARNMGWIVLNEVLPEQVTDEALERGLEGMVHQWTAQSKVVSRA